MNTPESIKPELEAWNDGAGIDVESWVGCEGRFTGAVGYSSIYWPEFTLFDGYILREGFSEKSLREFEQQRAINRRSVEWVMNHLHIADIHYNGCNDASKDKFIFLGNVLKEIYEAKLLWRWPEHPCTVEFLQPDDENELVGYQLSFWQKCHE